MVMKSHKRTVKTPVGELIIKFFMEDPCPIVITRAKDGAYVEVNKAALKLMGLPHKKIIGHTSIELGFFTPELRKLLIDDIKKQGFAKNIPGRIIVKNRVGIHLLFRAFPIKMGKETFFIVCATDIANHRSTIGELSDDKLFKITLKDDKFVKEKLSQYQLSPRQQEIALLSATGHTNSEIAKKLFISPYTVKDHQKEIFRIIGIQSRNELFPKLLNLR
jgi:DNA-binding CsgD family transcriptional regulator